MVADPPVTPSTTPVVPTVAIPVLPLLQTPPVATSEREVVAVAHTVMAPLMVPASGSGFTVTTTVAAVVPQEFVTV